MLPSSWHERLGSSVVYLTRLQDSCLVALRPARLLPPKRLLTPCSARHLSATNRGLLPGVPAFTRTGRDLHPLVWSSFQDATWQQCNGVGFAATGVDTRYARRRARRKRPDGAAAPAVLAVVHGCCGRARAIVGPVDLLRLLVSFGMGESNFGYWLKKDKADRKTRDPGRFATESVESS